MASSLSSLGLGSDGALNYDIIDQLREVDDAAQIKPITNKITENDVKQNDLSALTTYTASLKAVTSSLSSQNSYLQRSTNVSGDSVSVTAAAGTTIQDFSLDVKNLALSDVYQSRSFAEKTSQFTSEDDTIQISIGGETYDIEVDATTTITQLKDKIFDKTYGKVSASILNVGGDDPYKLIIKSTETGEDNAITISSTAGSAISLGLSNYEYIGTDANTFSGTNKIAEVQTLTFGAASSDGNITVAGISIALLSTDDTAEKVGAKVQAALALDGTVGTNVTDNLDGTVTITYNSDGVDEPDALFEDTGSTGVSYSVVEDTKGGEGDILTFTINGTDYDISVDDGDTITDISNKIVITLGDILNSKVENDVLVLESLDGNMTISSLNGSDIDFGLATLEGPIQNNHLQTAKDALMTFSGVEITRSSNSFDDLITGVSMTLQSDGISNVSITQDTEQIQNDVESFVSKYNDLMSNLNEATKFDVDTGNSGSFQGVSQVTSLKSSINRLLLTMDSSGNSLSNFGIALNDNGILEFDSAAFSEKLASDSAALENYFRGTTTVFPTSITGRAIDSGAIDITSSDLVINDTSIVVSFNGTPAENAESLKNAINSANITGIEAILNSDGTGIKLQSSSGYDMTISGDSLKLASLGLNAGATYGNSETTDGIFTKFNASLADYISGDDSIFSLYEAQLQTKEESLYKQQTSTIARLDTKYELMATRFAAYDSIIGKLNTQADSLLLMIEQSYSN